MADVKISELTALASASSDVAADVLAIVDTSATQTKKITIENLVAPITIDKSANKITSLGVIAGDVNITADGARFFVSSATNELVSIGRAGSSGASLQQGYFRMKSAGSNKVAFHTAGDSYINGGNVGIGTTSPIDLLDLRTDPGGTGQPGVATTGADTNNAIRISSTGNAINEKVGIAFGGYSGYVHGGIYGVATSLSNDTGGDITIDLRGTDGDDTFTEVIRFKMGGKVGIGTDSPGNMLHIQGADAGEVDNTAVCRIQSLESTDNRSKGLHISAGSTNDDWAIHVDDHDSSNTLMRLTGGGRLGLNTASPNARLHINEGTNGQECIFLNQTASGDQTYIQFRHESAVMGHIQIDDSEDTILYNTTSSDKRLKKDFKDWDDSVLPSFKSLKPKLFNFIHSKNNDGKRKGYIAQDNVDNFPEAYPKSKAIDGDDTEYYSFNPSGMVIYLMKAVQELSAKVEELEGK